MYRSWCFLMMRIKTKIIIINNDWKKLLYYLKEKKSKTYYEKKLDTDFKNSLGCAVVAYEKQWSQKFYDFGKYCELQFNLYFFMNLNSFQNYSFYGEKSLNVYRICLEKGTWDFKPEFVKALAQLCNYLPQTKRIILLNIDSNWNHDYYMIWNGNEFIKI